MAHTLKKAYSSFIFVDNKLILCITAHRHGVDIKRAYMHEHRYDEVYKENNKFSRKTTETRKPFARCLMPGVQSAKSRNRSQHCQCPRL